MQAMHLHELQLPTQVMDEQIVLFLYVSLACCQAEVREFLREEKPPCPSSPSLPFRLGERTMYKLCSHLFTRQRPFFEVQT
jgi:hypothetical protein